MKTNLNNSLINGSSYSGTDIMPAVLCYNPNTEQNEYKVLGNIQTVSYSVHRGTEAVMVLGRHFPKSFTRGGMLIAGSLIFTVFDRHSLYDFTKGSSSMYRVGPASMLPAFDLLMHMTNEYGDESLLIIYGVRIVDEGQTHSVEDVYLENTMSFQAHDIQLLEPLKYHNKDDKDMNKMKNYYKYGSQGIYMKSDLNYTFDTRDNLFNLQRGIPISSDAYSTQSTYNKLNIKAK